MLINLLAVHRGFSMKGEQRREVAVTPVPSIRHELETARDAELDPEEQTALHGAVWLLAQALGNAGSGLEYVFSELEPKVGHLAAVVGEGGEWSWEARGVVRE